MTFDLSRRSFVQLLAAIPALGVTGSALAHLAPDASSVSAAGLVADPPGAVARFNGGEWFPIRHASVSSHRDVLHTTSLDEYCYVQEARRDFSLCLLGVVDASEDGPSHLEIRLSDGSIIKTDMVVHDVSFELNQTSVNVSHISGLAIGETEFIFADDW